MDLNGTNYLLKSFYLHPHPEGIPQKGEESEDLNVSWIKDTFQEMVSCVLEQQCLCVYSSHKGKNVIKSIPHDMRQTTTGTALIHLFGY